MEKDWFGHIEWLVRGWYLRVFKKDSKKEECSKRSILIAKCTLLQLSIKRRQQRIVDSLLLCRMDTFYFDTIRAAIHT